MDRETRMHKHITETHARTQTVKNAVKNGTIKSDTNNV